MKTCLIVDDAKAIYLAARNILDELGFAAREAADDQKELRKAKFSQAGLL